MALPLRPPSLPTLSVCLSVCCLPNWGNVLPRETLSEKSYRTCWDVHNSTRQRRGGRRKGGRRGGAARLRDREGNLNGMQIKATDHAVFELRFDS